jgi:hypothetical protein
MRMMAEGGTEATIRIGDYELKQKLVGAEYQVYEFEVKSERGELRAASGDHADR